MQWANNLPQDNDRASAQRGIRSTAPVGIGARLSRGEDGLPVLQELVPGSPASASGQLRSGDRLLAVSDPNGSWINSRSMSIGDVAGLIQGNPETSVSIQVQSADGSAPRVVTLQRKQIIHRPGS
jgi:carboxyl-terminal processing protease